MTNLIPSKKLACGFNLPVYGLGLWEVGGRWEADHSKDQQEIETIIKAIELGLTHIDTAESYGNGNAEKILGQALKQVDRKKLFIGTKVSGQNQGYDQVKRSFEASLKRMGTDYVDLYLLHRFPAPGIKINDTMQAIDELVDQKLIRNVGVCNMSINRLQAVQNASANKIVCNQLHYNLQMREIEREGVLKYCQENDVMVVAWRPVQKGNLPSSALLDKLTAKYNKTLYQIAINWLITQQNVVTIAKTSSIEHLKENLAALDWNLESDDVELIRRDFPDQLFRSESVPLNYVADVAAEVQDYKVAAK